MPILRLDCSRSCSAPRNLPFRAVAGAAFLVALGLPEAFGQGLERAPAPVEVSVTPTSTIPGATVTITGRSVPLGENRTIRMRVHPPSGSAVELRDTLDDDYGFQVEFTETEAAGNYRVEAFSADGRNRAETTFAVQRPADLRADSLGRLQADFQQMASRLETTATTIQEAPASVTRDELEARLNALQEIVAGIDAPLRQLGRALELAEQGLEEGSPAPEAQEELSAMYEAMARTADEVARQRQAFDEQMARFDYEHTLCDGLQYVQEAWTLMTTALSLGKNLATAFTQGIGRMLVNVATDTGVGEAQGMSESLGGRGPDANLARTELFNQGKEIAAGSWGEFTAASTAAMDVVAWGTERVYRMVCERYVGPFTANMTAEIFDGGELYWTYSTALEGELRLRYERGGGGGAQPVTGEFDGVATGFTVKEDLWKLMPRIRRDILLRWVIPPLPGVYASSFGTFGRALTPRSFLVPVRGVIEGDRIRLEIQEARHDFDVDALAVYVLVNLAAPFPYVMTQKLPFQGGGFIISRALQGRPEFDIVVHRDRGYSEVQKDFSREAEGGGGTAKVTWSAHVNACNPECPG